MDKFKMTDFFYRFRSIDQLLGEYQELEKQTIYCAHPSQLNDPMEGYRDIYWKGDKIIWTNFFRHYLLCLENIASQCTIVGEEQQINENQIQVFLTVNKLPTDRYREIFEEIWEKFISIKDISTLIDKISFKKIPIRRDELLFYFRTIHFEALDSILHTYKENNFIAEKPTIPTQAKKYLKSILSTDFIGSIEENVDADDYTSKMISSACRISASIFEQQDLVENYNRTREEHNKYFLIKGFPVAYINKISDLLYPQWLAACFMSECKNSSIWGTYGHNHQGICLIFSPEKKNNTYFFTFHGVKGYSSDSDNKFLYGARKETLYPVEYTKGFGEIDFFRSIGRLSFSDLESEWYSDKSGNISECANNIMRSEKQWQERYWDHFIRDVTQKTDDWKHENEYRIIRSNVGLTHLDSMEERILTYDFSSLHGLIFGINTKEDDKLKIMRIIEKKCNDNNRTDFKLYQAYYCHRNHCIEKEELSFIQLKNS